MSGPVLVLIDHDRGQVEEVSLQVVAFGRAVGGRLDGDSVEAVVIGDQGASIAERVGTHVAVVHLVQHDALTDYAPEAWGDALAQLVVQRDARAVVGVGTDRGNEVLAHAAAVLGVPFITNVTTYERDHDDDASAFLTRQRWGGSLLEDAALAPGLAALSAAPHAFAPLEIPRPNEEVAAQSLMQLFTPNLGPEAGRTRVVERRAVGGGVTLQTAPVVVSGGRGVGSVEGFVALEQLAELLGGAVGCSRVVTNQGWRPHSDQVGQTGKRVAPILYIACGISGAIQHWIGMQSAQRVLAINIDKDAPMVTKADYAVIGDLHVVVPAIVAELQRRRA